MFQKIKRRGQVMTLYALLIPFLFLFVGVGLDLGWYYLNVSRLQNAADAAALAGAFELTEKDKTMRDYFVDGLTTEPSGVKDENYYSSFNIDTGEIDENGNSIINKVDLAEKNGLSVSELQQSKTEAHSYATQNLYDINKEHSTISGTSKTINEWTNNKNVAFSATLFTRILDADREKLSDIASTGFRYYKVQLTEKIDHLFMPGWFDPMDATVVAWAVIKPRDLDLVKNLNDLSGYKTIQNVIYQDNTKYNPEAGYKGKWAHFQDEGVYYTAGDVNRTEVVNIHNDLHTKNSKSDRTQNAYTGGGGNDNGTNIDSLNLDFRVEYQFNGTYNSSSDKKTWDWNWDLRSDLPEGITRMAASAANNWTDKAADMRLITSFNFNYAWTDRNLNDLVPDILWTHIESDPLWFEYGSSWNSVHQIVLNAHESNTAYTTISEQKVYTQRPFVIFYTGPEVYNANSTVRVSQPVILNLYNDWNAILYMPNSPVIINGNGHKLTGFVVAKEFRRLKTAEDMEAEKYIQVTDSYNKKIFVKEENLRTKAQAENEVADEHANATLSENSAGDLSFREETQAPKYLIIDPRYVKKFDDREEKFSDATDDDYIAALKKYKNITNLATETIKITFPEDPDAFGGRNNKGTYTVAKEDLSDTQDDSHPVQVLVDNGTETPDEKYIAKTNLPYVRVYTWSDSINYYPFVSVADLRIKTTSATTYEKVNATHPVGYAGVTLADTDHDVYTNNANIVASLEEYKIDTNKDTWKIERDTLLPNYKKQFKNKQFIKSSYAGGGTYFNLQAELDATGSKVIAEYRKVTDDEGNIFYIEEKEWSAKTPPPYYMEVLPDGATGKDAAGNDVTNPIIVDNWGDLQSMPITPSGILDIETETENNAAGSNSEYRDYFDDTNGYTRPTTSTGEKTDYEYTITGYPVEEQPGDPGRTTDSGKYVGTNGNRVKELYKVPALERVYYPSVKDKANNREIGFNLSSDSCYSYFQIEELKRVNYTYLNVDELNERVDSSNPNEDKDAWKVDDMFFTEKRGKWID